MEKQSMPNLVKVNEKFVIRKFKAPDYDINDREIARAQYEKFISLNNKED